MSLNADDITNLERGIDAAIAVIMDMAAKAMVGIATAEGIKAAGPLTGFLQALRDNPESLRNMALQSALLAHPDLEEAEVDISGPPQEGTDQ